MSPGPVFGVNVPNFGAGATEEALARWAAVAEDGPFGFLMVGDHVAPTPDVRGAYPGPFWDPLTTLAWFAGRTRRVGLGTTVIVMPYRHPLLLARGLAGIDRLSGGRLIVGVGVGWAAEEFAVLGADFARRGAVTDEYLDALVVAWTRDRATFHGAHVAFADVDTRPRPAQTPHPPLWVGGNGAAGRRRAVRRGQAWHPLRFPAGWLRRTGLPRLREQADADGLAVPALAPRILVEITEDRPDDESRLAGQGHPDQVRADLDELRALGATHVLLDTHREAGSAHDDHGHHWRTLERVAGWLE